MQLQQEKQTAKLNLLRKCGLLAHTSAAFLKKLLHRKTFQFACGSYPATNLNHKQKTDLQAFLQARFFNPLSSSFSSPNRTAHNCSQSQHCQNNSCNQSDTGTMI